MKKVLFSSMLVVALLSSNFAMAQDNQKTCKNKARTECTKDKKNTCPKDKKACDKTPAERKACCPQKK
ncbi:hypothetical protein [Dysgonomonas sp. 520]|uniref:hypothetical protein n=1 Tax=Dysgonomonas sp. 520 TaxID=2302931 RepID=UPI0013D38461|nr:hypothetical protein [Dysgonomonas sp. 520]NDW10282.1 hypothetical protein [Dysgonomonas sp. 520]